MSEIRKYILADTDDHELDNEYDTVDGAQLDAGRPTPDGHTPWRSLATPVNL